MRIQLSDHFTYRRLIRFTGPSILMMIFTSVYGMVDGFFISNYVGPTPFAAVNLIMPFIMIFGAVGMVFGTGGTALVSMLQGMGQKDKADRTFSFLIYFTIAVGIISSLIGWITVPAVARALGAADSMLPYCVHYTRVCMIGNTAFILQNMFQAFLITAEKPHFGFMVTLAAGAANMILDALFMGALGYGVRGAAAATVIGQCIGGLIPLIYFMLPGQNSSLRLVAAGFDAKALVRSCTNGLSEFLSDISMSVVSMLYNIQLMKFVGESGVAAYGVIMYANFIFVGVYFGYTIGAAPVIGYHYGAGNKQELHSLLKRSLILIASFMAVLTALAEIFAGSLTGIFVGYDADLHALTASAFRIYSISFIFMGFNIFGSGFFTALNNGFISALISFFRTFVFQAACVLLLPLIFGMEGIWFSIVAAELTAFVLTVCCLVRNRTKYGY